MRFTASEAWVNKIAAMNFASPVALGGHLFGLGPAKNVACIDLRTGALAWEKTGLVQT